MEFLWGMNEKMIVKNVTFNNSLTPLNDAVMQRLLSCPSCRWRIPRHREGKWLVFYNRWALEYRHMHPEIKQYVIVFSVCFSGDFSTFMSWEVNFRVQRAGLNSEAHDKNCQMILQKQWVLPPAKKGGFISPSSTTKNSIKHDEEQVIYFLVSHQASWIIIVLKPKAFLFSFLFFFSLARSILLTFSFVLTKRYHLHS